MQEETAFQKFCSGGMLGEEQQRKKQKVRWAAQSQRVVQEMIWLGGYLHLASLRIHTHAHPCAALNTGSHMRGFCTAGERPCTRRLPLLLFLV